MIFGDEYIFLSYSLCNFLYSPVTSFLLGPNILFRTLFHTHPQFMLLLNVRDQFSCPYKTTGRIMVLYMHIFRSRVSSGSIVSDYGLDDRAIGVRFPEGAKDFSSILCVQTGSGAHPASCPVGTGGPFPGDKSAAGA
jgi:hypothetical protein